MNRKFIPYHLPTMLLGFFILIMSALAFRACVFEFCNDPGRWILESALFAKGKIPYRDFVWQYPPSAIYLFGFWMKIFGSRIESAVYLIILISGGIALSFYRLLRYVKIEAWQALGITMLTVLSSRLGIHNVLFSLNNYAPSVPLGYGFGLLFFLFLANFFNARQTILSIVGASLCLTLSFLSKQEYALASSGVMVVLSVYLYLADPSISKTESRKTITLFWISFIFCLGAIHLLLIFPGRIGQYIDKAWKGYGLIELDTNYYSKRFGLVFLNICRRFVDNGIVILKEVYYWAFLILPFYWKRIPHHKWARIGLMVLSAVAYGFFLKRLSGGYVWHSPLVGTWKFLQFSYFILPITLLYIFYQLCKKWHTNRQERQLYFFVFLILFFCSLVFARQYMMGFTRYHAIVFYVSVGGSFLGIGFLLNQKIASENHKKIVTLFIYLLVLFQTGNIFFAPWARFSEPPDVEYSTAIGKLSLPKKEADSLNAMMSYLQKNTKPDEVVFGVPYGGLWSLLMRREYGYFANQFQHTHYTFIEKERILTELTSALPSYIIRLYRGKRNEVRGYQYLKENPFWNDLFAKCYEPPVAIAPNDYLHFDVYHRAESQKEYCQSAAFREKLLTDWLNVPELPWELIPKLKEKT